MFNFLIYSHLPCWELNLNFSGASDLQRTAGLGTSRNASQNCWIGHQQKHAQQNCWARHQWKHTWQNFWIGHQQKLFSLIYWKTAYLQPAIFRGTPGTGAFIILQQLDLAPAEKLAKIAGLGTSRNMPSKIAGLGTSRNTPGKITGLGTSRNYSI